MKRPTLLRSAVGKVTVLSACAVGLFGVSRAEASLIFSYPSYASRLSGSDNWDSGGGIVTLPFSFNFYGLSTTTATVAADGHINFAGAFGDYHNKPLNTASDARRICALWDDLEEKSGSPTSGAGAYVVGDASVTGVYTATWYNARIYNKNQLNTFQISLFGADETISWGGGSFNFKQGDIAISYDQVTAPFDSGDPGATVGVMDLRTGGTSSYTGLPTQANGLITDASLLPISAGTFLLYRPDNPSAPTSYTVTAASAATTDIPEPASLGVLALGGIALLARRRS